MGLFDLTVGLFDLPVGLLDLSVGICDLPITCFLTINILLLSTTELKIPSRTIVLQGWVSSVVSDVPKFKHGIISKRFEIEC